MRTWPSGSRRHTEPARAPFVAQIRASTARIMVGQSGAAKLSRSNSVCNRAVRLAAASCRSRSRASSRATTVAARSSSTRTASSSGAGCGTVSSTQSVPIA